MSRSFEIDVKLTGILIILLFMELAITHAETDPKVCSASAATVKTASCPEDKESWEKAAALKNCTRINHNCTSFVYHCLLNPWHNETIEVCAPYILVHGQVCAVFNYMRGPIRIFGSGPSCAGFTTPCPAYYNSSMGYKYHTCFSIKKHSTESLLSTELPSSTTNSRSSLFSTHITSVTTQPSSRLPTSTLTSRTKHQNTEKESDQQSMIPAIVIPLLIVIVLLIIALIIVLCKRQQNQTFKQTLLGLIVCSDQGNSSRVSYSCNQGQSGTVEELGQLLGSQASVTVNGGQNSDTNQLSTPSTEDIQTDILPGQQRSGDNDTQSSSQSARSQPECIPPQSQQTMQSENDFQNVQPPSVSSSRGLDSDGTHVTPPAEDITETTSVPRKGSRDEHISDTNSSHLLSSDESQLECDSKSDAVEDRNTQLSAESDKMQLDGLHSPQKTQHSQHNELIVLNRTNDSNELSQSEENQHQVASHLSEISKSTLPNTTEQDNSDSEHTSQDISQTEYSAETIGIQCQSPSSPYTSEPSDKEVAVQAPLPLPDNGSNQTQLESVGNNPTISLKAAREIELSNKKSLSGKFFTCHAEGNQKGVEEEGRHHTGGLNTEVDKRRKSSQGGPVVERGNSGDNSVHFSAGIVQESSANRSGLSDEQHGARGGPVIKLGGTNALPADFEDEDFTAKKHEKILVGSEEMRILREEVADVKSRLKDTVSRDEFRETTRELEKRINNLRSKLENEFETNKVLKQKLNMAEENNESLKKKIQERDTIICYLKRDLDMALKELEEYRARYGELDKG